MKIRRFHQPSTCEGTAGFSPMIEISLRNPSNFQKSYPSKELTNASGCRDIQNSPTWQKGCNQGRHLEGQQKWSTSQRKHQPKTLKNKTTKPCSPFSHSFGFLTEILGLLASVLQNGWAVQKPPGDMDSNLQVRNLPGKQSVERASLGEAGAWHLLHIQHLHKLLVLSYRKDIEFCGKRTMSLRLSASQFHHLMVWAMTAKDPSRFPVPGTNVCDRRTHHLSPGI